MTRNGIFCALLAALALAAAGTTLEAAAPGPSIDESARYLAGIPAASGSPLAPLDTAPFWLNHARFFDLAWSKLQGRRLTRIHLWEATVMHGSLPTMYYMFSGPDFLYADTFFPNATTYILCGTEPVGGVPDIAGANAMEQEDIVKALENSLHNVLSYGYFITKDMRTDLQNQQARGTVPIFLIFLARSHKHILDASFITLDGNGGVHPSNGDVKPGGSAIPGVKFTFKSETGGPVKTMYYFNTDISNSGIHRTPGFMKFCKGFGTGDSLVKSASYLMHSDEFSDVRSFLLAKSKTILEDDSGIPIRFFTPDKWTVRVFGTYVGPIGLFSQYYQANLEDLYKKSNPAPLDFGMGYRWDTTHTSLTLAVKR